MTLLGNDFLPHSLSIKIREDGHQFLLSELKALNESGQRLLVKDELWRINYDSIAWLMTRWAALEEEKLLHSFKRKIQMRGQVEINSETMPLENPVELCIVQREEKVWSLRQGWQDVYHKQWLFCPSDSDVRKCCEEYLVGLQWVLDYYTGQRQVNRTWYYPRLIPPLWCDISRFVQYWTPREPPAETEEPIKPEEQLAMVLPLQSWHHIPIKSTLRTLPSICPQFWPESFGFFTAGRIRTWECEPLLPILHIQTLRQAVKKETL